jgi:hypothetical protein
MKRNFIIFGFMMATTLPLAAQWSAGLSVGMASARMDDMKYLLDYFLDRYPVEGKIVSSFPSWGNGTIGVEKKILPNMRLGGQYSYASTGGRSNYSDYSGSISTNVVAASHRIGARFAYEFLGSDVYDLSVYGGADLNYTQMDIGNSIFVLGLAESIVYEYRSFSPAVHAGLCITVHFNDLSLGLEGGYMADIPGELSSREDDIELIDPLDRERILTSDWTGWHLRIRAMVNL